LVVEPGQVRRLSVAVAVDGVTAPAGANGQPGAYTARTAEEMQRIEALVRAAVGFDQARGDQINVVNVRFPTVADDSGVAAGNPLFSFDKNDIMRGAELGVLALVGLLMIFFVARPLLSGINAGAAARNAAAQAGAQITRMMTLSDGQQIAIGADGNPTLALTGPTSELEERIDIARIEGQVKASSVKRVSEFVEKHPDESVNIIRNWLHEST
jgi:flagellar M-ring protein FliF